MQKCLEHDIKMTLEDLAHRGHSKYSIGTGNEETLPKSWNQAINLIESVFLCLMDFNTDFLFVELFSFQLFSCGYFLLFFVWMFMGPRLNGDMIVLWGKSLAWTKWEPNPILAGFVY